jgi:hypothetical protein
MFAISPYEFKGPPRSCAGCGQPFVIRAGQSEAIVGNDGYLYCYDTVCERDALADKKLARKSAANGYLHLSNLFHRHAEGALLAS